MGQFVEPNKQLKTISNAPVEGYFNTNKNIMLEGNINIRATDYIRKSTVFCDARLTEVEDCFLKTKNYDKKAFQTNLLIDEDVWKKTPRKIRDRFNKNIVWQKVIKPYQKLSRKLKQKRYVFLKFTNIFQILNYSISFSPTIDISEF